MRNTRQLIWIVKRFAFVIGMLTASLMPAAAQQVEASVEGGYTTSEGFDASQTRQVLFEVYRGVGFTSGGSSGFTIGAFVGQNIELEFLWRRQSSTIELSNPAPPKTLASQDIDNYHGNFVYNWGVADAGVRPFVLLGFGATHYLPGAYGPRIPNGSTLAPIPSVTRPSVSLGGGIKLFPLKHVGVKGTARWTPTFVKTDAGGLWCDPFFTPCWVVPDTRYSNQFEFSGGIVFRFGGMP